jgi:hypothetical protein
MACEIYNMELREVVEYMDNWAWMARLVGIFD